MATAPHLPTAGKYGRRDMWAPGHGMCGPATGIFYVRSGCACARAFGRVEWVLLLGLPSAEALGYLLSSRGAGLRPRLAQKKGEPFDKLRASSGAPGRLLRPCSGFRLPASPGHPEKPHICQKKANMGHGICGPPADFLCALRPCGLRAGLPQSGMDLVVHLTQR